MTGVPLSWSSSTPGVAGVSSGGLGTAVPKEEAENPRIRSSLMAVVRGIIEEDGLTQARAAKLFGVTQPRISDLVRGKIELFSIDALVNMVFATGRRVGISIEAPKDEAAGVLLPDQNMGLRMS